jgi:uncharacterized protein (TIGR02147 family)
MKNLAPHEIITRAISRMKRNNPAYSMRALAVTVGISPSYLSRIFKGVKPIPMGRFEKLVYALRMDETSQRILRESIFRQTFLKNNASVQSVIDDFSITDTQFKPSHLTSYDERALAEFSILEPWHRVAVMDLVTCDNFNPSPEWVARRLGISNREAEQSLNSLKDSGLLILNDGKWSKTSKKIRFPNVKSNPIVRRYHQKMIEKAVKVLLTETDDTSFNNRLITAVSFAADPANIPKARQRLTEALFEVADILSDGNCTEVYQLNVQLFSLTKKDNG